MALTFPAMLVSAYWMLKRDVPYRDLGADWHGRRNDEAHARGLIAQLERLGHTVTLEPVTARLQASLSRLGVNPHH